MSRPLLHILIVTPNDIFRLWLILSHYCLSLCPYFINMYIGMRRSRNFCQGIQARPPENSSDNVFLVLNLFYSFTEGVQCFFKENYNFPRFQRGSNIFQEGGGVQLVPGGGGGPNANFYRNGYNL